MSEKGFATIFGLCLILVFALIVKGIQAAETNHAHETENLQAEFELQNAADSALVESADKVLSGSITLPDKNPYLSRKKSQYRFATITKTSKHFGKITVDVWGEKITIQPYEVNHATKTASRSDADKPSYIFFSVATGDIRGEKIYRRAFAYVEQGDETIHFMTLRASDYTFK